MPLVKTAYEPTLRVPEPGLYAGMRVRIKGHRVPEGIDERQNNDLLLQPLFLRIVRSAPREFLPGIFNHEGNLERAGEKYKILLIVDTFYEFVLHGNSKLGSFN